MPFQKGQQVLTVLSGKPLQLGVVTKVCVRYVETTIGKFKIDGTDTWPSTRRSWADNVCPTLVPYDEEYRLKVKADRYRYMIREWLHTPGVLDRLDCEQLNVIVSILSTAAPTLGNIDNRLGE